MFVFVKLTANVRCDADVKFERVYIDVFSVVYMRPMRPLLIDSCQLYILLVLKFATYIFTERIFPFQCQRRHQLVSNGTGFLFQKCFWIQSHHLIFLELLGI